MAWQEFHWTGRQRGNFVSVHAGRTISISKAIVDSQALGRFQYVKLFYDMDAQKMGLRFLSEREPGSAMIRHNPTTIIASVFIRSLGIANGRYHATWNEQDGLLECVFDRIGEANSATAA